MTRATENDGPGGRPRFPALRVAACCAGLVASAYLWMGWGWCWDLTPAELAEREPPIPFPGGWTGRYVRVTGSYWTGSHYYAVMVGREAPFPGGRGKTTFQLRGSGSARGEIHIWNLSQICSLDLAASALVLVPEEPADGVAVSGRVAVDKLIRRKGGNRTRRFVDATRGRFEGMSLIVVVVAFWSAVFLYLWLADWRRRQRRFAALLESESHAGGE